MTARVQLSAGARAELRALLLEAAREASRTDDRPTKRTLPAHGMLGWIVASASEVGGYQELDDQVHRAAGVPTTKEFFEANSPRRAG